MCLQHYQSNQSEFAATGKIPPSFMNNEIQGFKNKEKLTAPPSGEGPFPEGSYSYVLGPWVSGVVGESDERSRSVTWGQAHLHPCPFLFFPCWYQPPFGYPLPHLLTNQGISVLLLVNGELEWARAAGNAANEQPLRSSMGPFPSLKSAPTHFGPHFTHAKKWLQCSARNWKFELSKPWLLAGKLWSKHQPHLYSPRASTRCGKKDQAKQNRMAAVSKETQGLSSNRYTVTINSAKSVSPEKQKKEPTHL